MCNTLAVITASEENLVTGPEMVGKEVRKSPLRRWHSCRFLKEAKALGRSCLSKSAPGRGINRGGIFQEVQHGWSGWSNGERSRRPRETGAHIMPDLVDEVVTQSLSLSMVLDKGLRIK